MSVDSGAQEVGDWLSNAGRAGVSRRVGRLIQQTEMLLYKSQADGIQRGAAGTVARCSAWRISPTGRLTASSRSPQIHSRTPRPPSNKAKVP